MAPIQNLTPAPINSPIPYNKSIVNEFLANCPPITRNEIQLRKTNNVLVRVHGSLAVYTCLKNYEYDKGDMLRWCLNKRWKGQEPSCKVNLFHSKTFLVSLVLAAVFLMTFPFFCVDFFLKVRRSTRSRNINDTRLALKIRLQPQRILPDEVSENHMTGSDTGTTGTSTFRANAAIITLLDWVRENPKTPGLTTVALRDLQYIVNNRGVD